MNKVSFTWTLIISLVVILFMGSQISSNYTSSSSQDEVIDIGDERKNSIIKNKNSKKLKTAFKNLPPEKLEKLKRIDEKEFKNSIDTMMYEINIPKPLYSITAPKKNDTYIL